MKPPKGPFWAWNDINTGLKWHVCVIRGSSKEPMIYYVTEEFEDFWYDDDWEDGYIVEIKPPEPFGDS